MSKFDVALDEPTDLERMLEYIVDELGITSIVDLTKSQRNRLAYWVLIKNRLYMRVLRLMQRSINEFIENKKHQK